MATVYTAAMEIDTRYQPDPALGHPATWQAKCQLLQLAAADAETGFRQLNGGAAPAPGDLQILAAPEYLFGLPLGNASSSVNAYDIVQRQQIHGNLAGISGTYPNMLIVCGTVLYKRLMGREDRRQLTADLSQGAQNFAAGSPTRNQIEAAQRQTRLKGFGIKHYVNKKILGNPSGKLYGYNEALVFYGGHQVLSLKKAENAAEFSAENPQPTLIPGTGFGTFNYPGTGLVVGLEICADSGRLKAGGQQADIQILIAATKGMADSDLVTAQNKLVLVVNAQPQTAYAHQPNGGYIVGSDAVGVKLNRAQAVAAQKLAPVIGKVRCQVFNI